MKLPPLKVVGQVDTSQMKSGLKSAEALVKASQKRMQASQAASSMGRAAATPALGMLGGGSLGAGVGALGAFGAGGGAIGLSIAAAAAPLLLATSLMEGFYSSVKGSKEQLKLFAETGAKTSKLSLETLKSLAKTEARIEEIAQGPTLIQAMQAGARGQETVLDKWWKDTVQGARDTAADFGAATAANRAGIVMSPAEQQLRALSGGSANEGQSNYFAAQADAQRRREQLEAGTYRNIGPRDIPYLRAINRNTQ
jgi:hypothetical protein